MADRQFILESGRRLGLSAFGDPVARRLVVLCHPTPGAGGFDPDPLVTGPWGVHLLQLDRPGYGVSSELGEQDDVSVEGRADDLAEYITRSESTAKETQRVDFGAVGVVGWGTGGAFALSLAARHPDLVDRVTVVGTSAPRRRKPVDPDSYAAEFWDIGRARTVDDAVQALDALSVDDLAALGIATDDPALTSGTEIEQAGLRTRIARMLEEASLHGNLGIATDLLALRDHGWADDLGRITASVQLVYGADDPVADVSDGHWFAKRIPDSRVIRVENAGRLAIAAEWGRILEHVAPDHGGIGEAENTHSDQQREGQVDSHRS